MFVSVFRNFPSHSRAVSSQVWPQRPRYFAAPPPPCTTASVGGVSVGVACSVWGGTSLGRGVGFDPYLLDSRGVSSMEGGRSSSSLNHGLLQYSFAPFPKAAKQSKKKKKKKKKIEKCLSSNGSTMCAKDCDDKVQAQCPMFFICWTWAGK